MGAHEAAERRREENPRGHRARHPHHSRISHLVDQGGCRQDAIAEPSESMAETLLNEWAHVGLSFSHVSSLVAVHIADFVSEIGVAGESGTDAQHGSNSESRGRWLGLLTRAKLAKRFALGKELSFTGSFLLASLEEFFQEHIDGLKSIIIANKIQIS